jgi:hypothetical protein
MVGVVSAQHGFRRAGQGDADFGQGGETAAQALATHDHAVSVQQQDRGQGGAAGRLHYRVEAGGDLDCSCGRRAGGGRGGWSRGQDRRRAEVDGGGLGPVVARSLAPGRSGRDRDGARPVGLGDGRQGCGLGDQLRLGLADQGVLVDTQEDGAESR